MTQRKTIIFEEWNGDFSAIANDGDIVDNEIVEYFRDVLPPIMKRNKYAEAVQCTEATRHDAHGQPLYNTFTRFFDTIREIDKISPVNVWIFQEERNLNKTFDS